MRVRAANGVQGRLSGKATWSLGRHSFNSVLAEQHHRIDRQRASRWNPGSQQTQQEHGQNSAPSTSGSRGVARYTIKASTRLARIPWSSLAVEPYGSAAPLPCHPQFQNDERTWRQGNESRQGMSHFLRLRGECRANGRREPIPTVGFLTQRLATGGSEFIELGAAIVLRRAPVRFEQPLTDEAKQTGIERALFDQQSIARDLPMRRRMPYPCSGPRETALKMRRSRVPGRS